MHATLELTEAQQVRIADTLEFGRTVLSPGWKERSASYQFDRALWNQAAQRGYTGLPIPPEWGGSGLGPIDVMLVLEALGKGCEDEGLVFSISAHLFATVIPIWRGASPEQRERYLRRMVSGE